METRYYREYTNGVLTKEVPCEVSDEQVIEERTQKEPNDSHIGIQNLLKEWSNLPLGQQLLGMQVVFPALLKFYLVVGEKMGLFKVAWA